MSESNDGREALGLKLLPPSADPIPPAGMRDGDKVWYEPPVLPEPGSSGYWVIKSAMDVPNLRTKWPNQSHFMSPNPGLGRFEDYSEPVIWRTSNVLPRNLSEIWIGATHTVSERVLDIFREFDPDGVKSYPVDWEFKNGTKPKYEYYWIHINRKIKAIDFANSKIMYFKREGYDVSPIRFGPIRLMPEASLIPYFCAYPQPGPHEIFISSEVRNRLIEEKIMDFNSQDLSAWPLFI